MVNVLVVGAAVGHDATVVITAIICGLAALLLFIGHSGRKKRFRARFANDPDVEPAETMEKGLLTRAPHRSAQVTDVTDEGHFWDVVTQSPALAWRSTFELRRRRGLITLQDALSSGETVLGVPEFDRRYRLYASQPATLRGIFTSPDLRQPLLDFLKEYDVQEVRLRENGELFFRCEQRKFTEAEMKDTLLAVTHFVAVMERQADAAPVADPLPPEQLPQT